MKRYILMIMALALPLMLSAQSEDDDMYFVPSKKSAQKSAATNKQLSQGEVERIQRPHTVDYGSNRRSEDEYNRRYSTNGYTGSYRKGSDAATDTLMDGTVERISDTNDDRDYDDAYDYAYSRRILRFHSPRIGIAISSPWYWDMVYDYGVYDYLYDSYYYNPYLYNWGWSYGMSWGPWASWYGPIWGWSHPYAWTYWGWGPGWCGPGWHGHGWYGVNRGRYSYRGTMANRYGAGERIRTSALAGGANAATGRGTFGTRTSALGRGGYDTRTSTFNRNNIGTVNNPTYNRNNSNVIRGLGRTDGTRTSVNRQSTPERTTNNYPERTSVNRNTYTPQRSSGSTFGGGSRGGSFSGGGGVSRGGGFGGGGGVSRGGGRR